MIIVRWKAVQSNIYPDMILFHHWAIDKNGVQWDVKSTASALGIKYYDVEEVAANVHPLAVKKLEEKVGEECKIEGDIVQLVC